MGLSHTTSEETPISVENLFFHPVYLMRPRRRDPLVIGYRRVYGQQEARIIALPDRERSSTISSAVCGYSDNSNTNVDLTLPVVNLFWLARVLLVEVRWT